jgi:hypothetical protein
MVCRCLLPHQHVFCVARRTLNFSFIGHDEFVAIIAALLKRRISPWPILSSSAGLLVELMRSVLVIELFVSEPPPEGLLRPLGDKCAGCTLIPSVSRIHSASCSSRRRVLNSAWCRFSLISHSRASVSVHPIKGARSISRRSPSPLAIR